MTSEQIQKLNLMVSENGARLPDGGMEAVSLMHVQMLGEIAYQLAVANEQRNAPQESERWKCPHCGVIATHSRKVPRQICTCGAWMDAA
jgi:ribosomal protein S27AE